MDCSGLAANTTYKAILLNDTGIFPGTVEFETRLDDSWGFANGGGNTCLQASPIPEQGLSTQQLSCFQSGSFIKVGIFNKGIGLREAIEDSVVKLQIIKPLPESIIIDTPIPQVLTEGTPVNGAVTSEVGAFGGESHFYLMKNLTDEFEITVTLNDPQFVPVFVIEMRRTGEVLSTVLQWNTVDGVPAIMRIVVPEGYDRINIVAIAYYNHPEVTNFAQSGQELLNMRSQLVNVLSNGGARFNLTAVKTSP